MSPTISEKLLAWARTQISIRPQRSKRKPVQQVSVSNENRERHTYIIGRSRYGKTNLVKNIIVQTVEQGMGLSFLDVHGDAAEELLGCMPVKRARDVIYYDPSDPQCLALNILKVPYDPDKLTKDIVGFFKGIYKDSWGDRLENILLHGIYTLVCDMRDNDTSRSFRDIPRMLNDENFRRHLVRTTKRDSERMFWEEDFARYPRNAIDPVLTRISKLFLSGSMSERIFSEPENDISLFDILNEEKILIVNLARGKLGKEYSSFLGSVFMQGIVEAAFARARMNPNQRRMHHLFVDEFQEFVQGSPFEDILSQTGKYKLAVTMSHQFLNQLPSSLQAAIFGNVTTKVAFHISAADVNMMMREMKGKKRYVRLHGQSEHVPFEEMVEIVRKHLTEALARYQPQAKPEGANSLWWAANNYGHSFVRADLEWAVRALSSPTIHPKALKEVMSFDYGKRPDFKDFMGETVTRKGIRYFADAEFIEEPYPGPEDLLNLDRFFAFSQVGKASDVKRFKTLKAKDPDKRISDWIHKQNQKRYQERLARRAETKPETMTTPAKFDETDHPELEN